MPRLLRYFWTLPNTLLGLLLALPALMTGGGVRLVSGVIEVHGGVLKLLLKRCIPIKGGAGAITFGHVVLGRDSGILDRTRPHERVHVRQYERWGPLFIPAYLGASLVALWRGTGAYHGNRFERHARSAAPLSRSEPEEGTLKNAKMQ